MENIIVTKEIIIAKGEFVAILAPSGSGKTVFMDKLRTFASVCGQDLSKLDSDKLAVFRREKMGYISREFRFLEHSTVKENIALPLVLGGKPAKETNEIVEGMMDFFGIDYLSAKMPSELSNEDKQRVSAARAMVVNPVICFADEPTGNLDSASTANIMEMLSIMNADGGITILLATHDSVVASYARRVLIMEDGEFIAEIACEGHRREFLAQILDLQFDLYAPDKPVSHIPERQQTLFDMESLKEITDDIQIDDIPQDNVEEPEVE